MCKGQLQALDEGGGGALAWAGGGRAQAVTSRWAQERAADRDDGEGGGQEGQEQPWLGVGAGSPAGCSARSGPCPVPYPGDGVSAGPEGTGRAACGDLPTSEHSPAGDGHGPSPWRSPGGRIQRETPPCSSPGTSGDAPRCLLGAASSRAPVPPFPRCNPPPYKPSATSPVPAPPPPPPRCIPQSPALRGERRRRRRRRRRKEEPRPAPASSASPASVHGARPRPSPGSPRLHAPHSRASRSEPSRAAFPASPRRATVAPKSRPPPASLPRGSPLGAGRRRRRRRRRGLPWAGGSEPLPLCRAEHCRFHRFAAAARGREKELLGSRLLASPQGWSGVAGPRRGSSPPGAAAPSSGCRSGAAPPPGTGPRARLPGGAEPHPAPPGPLVHPLNPSCIPPNPLCIPLCVSPNPLCIPPNPPCAPPTPLCIPSIPFCTPLCPISVVASPPPPCMQPQGCGSRGHTPWAPSRPRAASRAALGRAPRPTTARRYPPGKGGTSSPPSWSSPARSLGRAVAAACPLTTGGSA